MWLLFWGGDVGVGFGVVCVCVREKERMSESLRERQADSEGEDGVVNNGHKTTKGPETMEVHLGHDFSLCLQAQHCFIIMADGPKWSDIVELLCVNIDCVLQYTHSMGYNTN